MAITRKIITGSNPADGTTATALNSGVETVTANAGSSLTYVTDTQFSGTVLQTVGGAGVTTLVRDAFDSDTMNQFCSWGFAMKTPASLGGNATVFAGRVGTALSGQAITGGARGFSLQWSSSGILSLFDSANTIDTVAAAGKMAADTWYYITIRSKAGSTTAGEVRIKVYAISDTTLSSPIALVTSTDSVHLTTTEFTKTTCNLTANNYLATDWAQMGVTGTMRFANMQYNDGGTTELTPYAPSNTAPTLDAGADQSVSAGATVNLSALASDADGDSLTYSWSVVYSSTTSPTITGASTATPSFTASATEGQRYILQCTVTDGHGGSTSDTVTINVPTGSDFTTLPDDGNNVSWTKVGSAATKGGSLSDSDDSTRVRSPDYSGTASEIRIPLQPLKPRSSLSFTVRSLVSATGGVTKVRLYAGNTMKQEWSITQSLSAVNQTLTVTTGNLPGTGEWENLYIAGVVST